MSKNTLNKIVNPLLFLSVGFQAITGLTIAFISSSERLIHWHLANGLILAGLIVIHLFLNWPWIKSQIFGIKPL